jgi:hypothetical protein
VTGIRLIVLDENTYWKGQANWWIGEIQGNTIPKQSIYYLYPAHRTQNLRLHTLGPRYFHLGVQKLHPVCGYSPAV